MCEPSPHKGLRPKQIQFHLLLFGPTYINSIQYHGRVHLIHVWKLMQYILILTVTLLLSSCSKGQPSIDYGALTTYSTDGHLQMVVEIPAGTNKKFEYNYESRTFPADIKNGNDRVISFLPYPGNNGFIPSTKMDRDRGGDGDALDILLLSEHLPTKHKTKVPVRLNHSPNFHFYK